MRFLYARERGFTLVEVIVAAGIVAVIAAVVFTNVSEARKKARDVQRVSDLAQLQIALKLYNDVYGTYNVGNAVSGGEGLVWVSTPEGEDEIAQTLYAAGFLPVPYLHDPNPSGEDDYGYILTLCDEGRRYAVFATKEIPIQSDAAQAESLCMVQDKSGPMGQYGKNYGVGN